MLKYLLLTIYSWILSALLSDFSQRKDPVFSFEKQKPVRSDGSTYCSGLWPWFRLQTQVCKFQKSHSEFTLIKNAAAALKRTPTQSPTRLTQKASANRTQSSFSGSVWIRIFGPRMSEVDSMKLFLSACFLRLQQETKTSLMSKTEDVINFWNWPHQNLLVSLVNLVPRPNTSLYPPAVFTRYDAAWRKPRQHLELLKSRMFETNESFLLVFWLLCSPVHPLTWSPHSPVHQFTGSPGHQFTSWAVHLVTRSESRQTLRMEPWRRTLVPPPESCWTFRATSPLQLFSHHLDQPSRSGFSSSFWYISNLLLMDRSSYRDHSEVWFHHRTPVYTGWCSHILKQLNKNSPFSCQNRTLITVLIR